MQHNCRFDVAIWCLLLILLHYRNGERVFCLTKAEILPSSSTVRLNSVSYTDAFNIKQKFESSLHKKCSKYPFFEKFESMIRNPFSDYLIFVYHEHGSGGNGGLGDRLAGMITALAFALRTKRTFLIVGDDAFEKSFRPYFNPSNKTSTDSNLNPSWANWDWSGWKREFSANMTKLHCINPRPSQRFCALDRDAWKTFKVIKYFGNRSYLCRWNIKPSLNLESELLDILGIRSAGHFFSSSSQGSAIQQVASGVDLYEVAGCLLRLALNPTELLWSTLDQSLQAQMSDIFSSLPSEPQKPDVAQPPSPSSVSPPPPTTTITTTSSSSRIVKQIGFHFRCGDSSFTSDSHGAPARARNPQCWANTTYPESWLGTSFTDDKSMDSPVDLALCGHQVLMNSTDQGRGKSSGLFLLYLASDNPISSQQINETLQHLSTGSAKVGLIRPPKACHVDLSRSGSHCSMQTAVHWFMLALSDHLVLQALLPPAQGFSMYESGREGAQFDPFTSPFNRHTAAPVSAFSRYAAIYSLHGDASIRYGRSCDRKVSTALLSHQSHGNWVCDPKMFY